MGTVYITNVAEGLDVAQSPFLLAQGTSGTNKKSIPVALSTTGEIAQRSDNVLDDASGINLWSGSNPTTFKYLWFWSNKAVDLQFFGASANFSIRTRPNFPMILPTDDIVITADTTEFSSDPTTEDIVKIRLWNSSGAAAMYRFALID